MSLTPIEGALKIISLYRNEIIEQGATSLTVRDVSRLLKEIEDVLRI